MLSKRRRRAEVVPCSTLFRSLVVILIIGILAAIAIPSFLNQKSKANDASAKELARTAQTTAETIATDNGGDYTTVSTEKINEVEKSVPLKEVNGAAFLTKAEGSAKGFTVEATAGKASGNTYTIESKEGVVKRTCTKAGTGSCPSTGEW